MIKNKSLTLIIVALVGLSLAMPSAYAAKRRFLSIASGWVTGPYYVFSGAVSRVAWKHLREKNIKVTSESSGASVANAKLIATGDTDFAILQNDIASYAHNGQLMFDKPTKNLLGCFVLFPETVQLVARNAANINSIADLKGKRVSVGPLGSGTVENARQILAAWGLSEKDMKSEQLKTSQAADYMKDGRLDAFFATAAAPHANIMDVHIATPAHIVPITGPNVEKLMKQYSFYTHDTIPGGLYKGVDQPVKTVAVMAMMAARADLEKDVVYSVVKAVYDDLEQIKQAHAKFQIMDVKSALAGMSVPLHPGAEKYFKEVGILK